MTTQHTTTVPFADWGPTDRYWLEAFDPDCALHRFLPVGSVDRLPFPQERMELWERRTEARKQLIAAFNQTVLPFSTSQKKSLEALEDSRAMVVATGQQPGALGGPLYTFAKILSAIAFAETLSREWNVPVIPILWDGGDDHDLEEIGRLAWTGGPEGSPTMTFDLSEYSGRSAWEVPFKKEMLEEGIRFAESHHPATDYREATLDFLRKVGEDGLSWSDYFDRFWLKIFEETPLLIVRPWEEGFRKLAEGVLMKEIENPVASLEDLSKSSTALAAAGYSPRIHKKAGSCSFFTYRDGRRRPVRVDESGRSFSPDGTSPLSKEELIADLKGDPGLFSPNALLRPIVQDAILPTAATVLGPGEIAYHSQIGAMYERHGIPRPWVLPRFSISLLGANQRSRLEEMGLSFPDLRRDANELSKSLVSSEDLDTSLSVLDDLLDRTKAGREKLLGQAQRGKLGSPKGIESQFGRIEKTLNQISDLLRREEMKQNADLLARLKGLQELLLPPGGLQERSVGLVPFLCRFGFDWLKEIREEARGWTGKEHVVYTP